MGNATPTLDWSAPHPTTADGAHERIYPLVAFLLDRFITYGDVATNFFALQDARFKREQFCYLVVGHDVAVLADRFGIDMVQEALRFRLETLRLLLERALARQALAKKCRVVFGGVAIGGATALVSVAAVPLVLGTLGFSTAGVVGGSFAAGVQSSFYGAYTTGLFSLCQGVGAVGVSAGTTVGLTSLGLGVGGVFGGKGAAKMQGEEIVTGPQLAPTFSWESGKSIDELWEESRQ